VSKLKQDLQAKEEEREAAVRSLRQEHEKMKSRYEAELRKAKASANAAGGNKSSRVKVRPQMPVGFSGKRKARKEQEI